MNRDVGELLGIGIRVDRAVTVDQHLIGHEHEKYAGDDVGAGGGFDDLQRWAHGVGGGVYCAGDQPVHFVQCHHDGALHHGVLQFLQCFFRCHAFVFAHFDQRCDVVRARLRRIHDFEFCRYGQALLGGHALDVFAFGHQHATRDFFLGTDDGGFDGARFFAFGQHDAFIRLTCFFDQQVTELRW